MTPYTGAQRLSVLRSRLGSLGRLVCWSCQLQRTVGRRSLSSTGKAREKPFYVTTPIFYVNSSPHIGHAHSMVLADVYRRWEELKGREAIASTGTDEHGLKVQQSAFIAGLPPMEFCDMNTQKFRELADQLMEKHQFIRTTDVKHVNAVEQFWKMLNDRGLIYETTHKGWYSIKDECFYPIEMIEQSVDRLSGKRVLMAGGPDGTTVEWVEERNYHFRLTTFKDRLLEFYKGNPEWIKPKSRMNEVLEWVENHLEDLSISRPADRLKWGIPVPNDPSQTIYVWVDALINYLSNAGYPNWTPQLMRSGGWPADLHIIGKDILRFHAVYWPALLMAMDLPLPKRLLSHAHWTMGRKKISKSAGNGVEPQSVVSRFGLDAVRWFLMSRGAIKDDASWDNALVARNYRSFLAGTYGNLLNRVLSPRFWSIKETVAFMRDNGSGRDENFKHLVQLATLSSQVNDRMNDLRPDQALGLIAECLMDANRYISEAEPWRTKDDTGCLMDEADVRERARPIIYRVTESLRICSILLQPFMPEKAAQALDKLGVSPQSRTYGHASSGCDASYGPDDTTFTRGEKASLFPPLDTKEFPPDRDEPLVVEKEQRLARRRELSADKEYQKMVRIRNMSNGPSFWLAEKKGSGQGEQS